MRRLIVVAVIALVAIGALLGLREALKRPAGPTEAARPKPVRVVTLYFGTEDASSLKAEPFEIKAEESDLAGLSGVVEALVAGPTGGGIALCPSGTAVRGVYINDKVAYVDFSREIVDNFTGGSAGERMLVSSLVQTICANFPEVEAVKILVEGREIETIGGHLDVSGALRPTNWR